MSKDIIKKARKTVKNVSPELLKDLYNARTPNVDTEFHAYPFTHQQRFKKFDSNELPTVHLSKKDIPLYIEIPWCITKCIFCCYTKSLKKPTSAEVMNYINNLGKNLELILKKIGESKITPRNIYIGGGTPTILDSREILYLFHVLKKYANLEGVSICCEASPGTLTKEKITTLKKCGVNRISLGVQSLDDNVLAFSRRDHDSAQVRKAYDNIVSGGINNVNFDLLIGLPKQNVKNFSETLEKVINMRPTSISFLDLVLSPKCELSKKAHKNDIPSWEDQILMRTVYQERMKKTDYIQTRPHYYILNQGSINPKVPCLNVDKIKTGIQIGIGYNAWSQFGDVITINSNSKKFDTQIDKGYTPLDKGLKLSEREIEAITIMRSLADTMKLPENTNFSIKSGTKIAYLNDNKLLLKNKLTKEGCILSREIYCMFYP